MRTSLIKKKKVWKNRFYVVKCEWYVQLESGICILGGTVFQTTLDWFLIAAVFANSASICIPENSTFVKALLVLAGDSAETPVWSPKCPLEASPPGAHPEFHYSPGELSRDLSAWCKDEGRWTGHAWVTSLCLPSFICPHLSIRNRFRMWHSVEMFYSMERN